MLQPSDSVQVTLTDYEQTVLLNLQACVAANSQRPGADLLSFQPAQTASNGPGAPNGTLTSAEEAKASEPARELDQPNIAAGQEIHWDMVGGAC